MINDILGKKRWWGVESDGREKGKIGEALDHVVRNHLEDTWVPDVTSQG